MTTLEEYAKQPLEKRLARLARAPDDLAAAIVGQTDAVLARRPDAKNWAAKEILCHLRDTEESFMMRFESIMAMDDPKFLAVNPDRWAEERQYLRNLAGEALAAFRKRREDSLAFLRRCTPEQLGRSGIHATRGRMTIDDFVTMMAWHDDNHLDQLRRALQGHA
jgi:DinB family protein